jgi:hypothetical protein
MRKFEFLIERNTLADPATAQLKLELAKKIKSLPADETTMKTLKEIEDLLAHVNAGGRIGLINNLLKAIPDPAVQEVQRTLAKYIAGLTMDPADRTDLFDKWKSDNLVNRKLLLTPGRHTFGEVINGYDSNPAIKELTDELAKEQTLGHGKGEFLLNVFSKNINKGEKNKGDLIINKKPIEVKTYDKGGARFGDQEVKPAKGYYDSVDKFIENIAIPSGVGFPKAGINIGQMIQIHQNFKDEAKFKQYLEPVVQKLFTHYDSRDAVTAILANDENRAKAEFAKANLANYMAQKHDYGILYIALNETPPTFVFFRDNDELESLGLRLHISTQYVATNDPTRIAGQFSVVPSGRIMSQPLEPIAAQLKSKSPDLDANQLKKDTFQFAKKLANSRKVTDATTIKNISFTVFQQLQKGVDIKKIIPALEKLYPELKIKKISKKSTSQIDPDISLSTPIAEPMGSKPTPPVQKIPRSF